MSTTMWPVGCAMSRPGADRGGDRLLDQRHLARAGRQARLLDRARLDVRDAGRHAHHHALARPAAAVRLAQEVAQHLLGDLEVRDHAVAQRARGRDVGRRAPDHAVRLRADRVDVAVLGVDGDHGGFRDDDAAPAFEHERVGRAEIDGEIALSQGPKP